MNFRVCPSSSQKRSVKSGLVVTVVSGLRLVDLTGDGTLDVWVEQAYYGVVVISFQNGEFKWMSVMSIVLP